MERREFLIGGLAAGAGAVALGSCGGAAPGLSAPSPPAPAATGWAAVKAEVELAPELVHMAGFFLASRPRVVRDAIAEHRRELDANPFEYIEHHVARLELEVRGAAARYLGADADQLAMTDSTTMGLGTYYG